MSVSDHLQPTAGIGQAWDSPRVGLVMLGVLLGALVGGVVSAMAGILSVISVALIAAAGAALLLRFAPREFAVFGSSTTKLCWSVLFVGTLAWAVWNGVFSV